MIYREHIKTILDDVKSGQTSPEEALQALRYLPYEDLGFANIDHHRALRQGFPEVVFCENKTPQQIALIMKSLSLHHDVLATRATSEAFSAVNDVIPGSKYHETARAITFRHPDLNDEPVNEKKILVVSAGTSDLPVAEEAVITAQIMRNTVEPLYDVGVAGIHRLLGNKEKIDSANVLVVVAGMDGVLPSVVGGLVAKPVIAVPTSVGYGANFEGLAPLLTMLNSCSPGVVVVNIDNGFGAGYFASLVNK